LIPFILGPGRICHSKAGKTYADKSLVMGMPLTKNSKLILVDYVITSGKAIRESLEILQYPHG